MNNMVQKWYSEVYWQVFGMKAHQVLPEKIVWHFYCPITAQALFCTYFKGKTVSWKSAQSNVAGVSAVYEKNKYNDIATFEMGVVI